MISAAKIIIIFNQKNKRNKKLYVLTKEQKKQKIICSYVLMSKILCNFARKFAKLE